MQRGLMLWEPIRRAEHAAMPAGCGLQTGTHHSKRAAGAVLPAPHDDSGW